MTTTEDTQTGYKSIIDQALAEIEEIMKSIPDYMIENRADFLLGFTTACRVIKAKREQSTKRMGNRKPLPALKAPVKVTK